MVVACPQRILAWKPESDEALEYFCSIDWCRDILVTPGLDLFKCDYVHRKHLGWDPVVSGILARRDVAGVRHFLSSIVRPGVLPPLNQSRNMSSHHPSPGNPFPQHINFYTIGADLAGIPNTAHGGIIALLIDSVFAQLGFLHSNLQKQFYSSFTNVRFLRPLILPKSPAVALRKTTMFGSESNTSDAKPSSSDTRHLGGVATVIVRAQIDSIKTKEGDDKMHVFAQVETGGGMVCAVGEGLIVEKIWKSRL
ncbi:uncharacterized protein PG998_004699 [Apiospora kogelbergensis]|uniref:uncharacterized protein n=1 Tax=Apiospora kogelbergensis TaxID=1337665 RepID=UPI003130CD65